MKETAGPAGGKSEPPHLQVLASDTENPAFSLNRNQTTNITSSEKCFENQAARWKLEFINPAFENPPKRVRTHHSVRPRSPP